MKKLTSFLLLVPLAAFLFTVTASCERKDGPVEEFGEAIDDATDSRPAEGIRDAVENATGNN